MKRMLFCVVAMMALSAVAHAGLVEEGFYKWYVPGDAAEYVQVHEKVFLLGDGEGPDNGKWAGDYLYSYTLINDRFKDPKLWCWGMQDPRLSGALIYAIYSPANWTGSYGCAWQGYSPAPVSDPLGWIANTTNDGITQFDSLDNFWFISPNKPFALYDAFAHDNGGTDGIFAVGKVSGPTPEPASAFLLLLGALPIAALRRRKS